jgi:hypothetical protein
MSNLVEGFNTLSVGIDAETGIATRLGRRSWRDRLLGR